MITVHHLNNSRSQRVLWLLEELGLPYDVERYERNPETMLAPPELQQVHPLGKSPVITELGKSTWFTGADFTAADIQLSVPLEAAAARAGLDASRPQLMAFLDRVHARPAYQKALKRGGVYEFLS